MVAHTVATLLRPLEKNIQVKTSNPEHVWPVLIDRHQLENVLLNLALNARDAMPDGGTLKISLQNCSLEHSEHTPAGDYVCLDVADTGIGMPADMIDQAFEPFFTTKPTGSGTGLGLSMAYGFIKQSGGHIKIDSKLGQGTTICIMLPRTMEVQTPCMPAADGGLLSAKGDEAVLVTEDDPAVRRVAVRILRTLGYRTYEAENGREALQVLDREPGIDLLFADIMLTGDLNGAQLAQKARALHAKLAVLFASGYAEPAVRRESGGIKDIPLLSKPYDADELAKLVRRQLDRRNGRPN